MNRPFPHSTSVRTNNRTRARLGWTFSYICCIFVQPNLDSVPLFVGMREWSLGECKPADPCLFSPNPSICEYFCLLLVNVNAIVNFAQIVKKACNMRSRALNSTYVRVQGLNTSQDCDQRFHTVETAFRSIKAWPSFAHL